MLCDDCWKHATLLEKKINQSGDAIVTKLPMAYSQS